MDNNPKSLANQQDDSNTQGAAMLQKWQFPNGIISPLMLAATPTVAAGDQYYSSAGGIFARLPIGTTGQVLTVTGGLPVWQTPGVIPTVPTDGWTPETATLTYASATSVTTSGTITAYTKGARVKFTNNSITYYGAVASTSGSTINFSPNSDFSINNSAITSPSYSYAVNPQGYPGIFNFATTWTGFTVNPTGAWSYYITGNVCSLLYADASAGTSSATTVSFTGPVAALKSVAQAQLIAYKNNGTNSDNPPGHLQTTATSNVISAWTSFFQGGWTAGGTNKDIYPGLFSYVF